MNKINHMAPVQTYLSIPVASVDIVYRCRTISGARNLVPKSYGIRTNVIRAVRCCLQQVYGIMASKRFYDTSETCNSALKSPDAPYGEERTPSRPQDNYRHPCDRRDILQICPEFDLAGHLIMNRWISENR